MTRYNKGTSISAIAPLLALAALRVCRRWNQTGQKYAGSPDIARSFLTEHNILLWILITATYASTSFSLARTGFPSLARPQASALAFAVFVLAMNFKIAFTLADAPELLRGINPLNLSMLSRYSGNLDLVSNARILFASLGGCLAYTLLTSLIAPSPTPIYHKGTILLPISAEYILTPTSNPFDNHLSPHPPPLHPNPHHLHSALLPLHPAPNNATNPPLPNNFSRPPLPSSAFLARAKRSNLLYRFITSLQRSNYILTRTRRPTHFHLKLLRANIHYASPHSSLQTIHKPSTYSFISCSNSQILFFTNFNNTHRPHTAKLHKNTREESSQNHKSD